MEVMRSEANPQTFIRELTTDDELAAAAEVIRAAFATVTESLGITRENWPHYSGFVTKETLQTEKDQGGRLFGLFENERQVGFVQVYRGRHDDLHFRRLSVLPEHRHRGYGRRLVEFVENLARESGVARVTLGLAGENARLKRWYESQGYRATEERRFPGVPCAICFMEKDLPAKRD